MPKRFKARFLEFVSYEGIERAKFKIRKVRCKNCGNGLANLLLLTKEGYLKMVNEFCEGDIYQVMIIKYSKDHLSIEFE